MPNVIEQAISTDNAGQAAKLIKRALGIESDDVVNYCFPISWPVDLSNARASSVSGCRPKRAIRLLGSANRVRVSVLGGLRTIFYYINFVSTLSEPSPPSLVHDKRVSAYDIGASFPLPARAAGSAKTHDTALGSF
jgi:hypothetical protein